jgi:hypothetical protein
MALEHFKICIIKPTKMIFKRGCSTQGASTSIFKK